MQKNKVLILFLGVALLAGLVYGLSQAREADAAFAYAEAGLDRATGAILESNMSESTKNKLLEEVFVNMPRIPEAVKIRLSQSNAAATTTPSGTPTVKGKSATAQGNVCKGLFKAFDSTTSDTAKAKIQLHITDRACTR